MSAMNPAPVPDFRAMTEASPVHIWTALPTGALDYVNQTVCVFFGRSFERMIGEGWLDMLHPADVQPTIDRWTHSLRTGELYNNEFRLRSGSDGLYYWFCAQATPLRDAAGAITGWVGSNTNVNDLKRLVEIAEARQETIRRERDRLLRETTQS